eukprot:4996576-Karenia_brevis.AAC.2
MEPGFCCMEPSRKREKGARGTATRLRAKMARLRATRPCDMSALRSFCDQSHCQTAPEWFLNTYFDPASQNVDWPKGQL